MTMPLILTSIFERPEWLEFGKGQFERFEHILVKEVLANKELVKTLQGKLGEIKSYRGLKGE